MRRLNIVRTKGTSKPAPARKVGKVGYKFLDTFGHKVLRFDSAADISGEGSKTFDVVKDGDVIMDYQNVRIKGYLSTFKATTESDRQGDYVEKGAFRETIPNFMRKNPVLLANHRNNVESLVGNFIKMMEDEKGLYFEALISNSPESLVKDVRFKLAEGMLRTCSMGGLFHYKEDGRGIFKVDLFEGSLTPIPANPDALYSVREATEAEIKQVRFGTQQDSEKRTKYRKAA